MYVSFLLIFTTTIKYRNSVGRVLFEEQYYYIIITIILYKFIPSLIKARIGQYVYVRTCLRVESVGMMYCRNNPKIKSVYD